MYEDNNNKACAEQFLEYPFSLIEICIDSAVGKRTDCLKNKLQYNSQIKKATLGS